METHLLYIITETVGVNLHFLVPSQGNRGSFPRIHPHAEGSTNPMEPLDSKVTLKSTSTRPFFKTILINSILWYVFPQSFCRSEQRCGPVTGDQEKS